MVTWRSFLYVLVIALLVRTHTVLAQSSDAHAIYSVLLERAPAVRSGPGNVPTDDEIYLIEATTTMTRGGIGGPLGAAVDAADSCRQVPPADAAAFQEILADYYQRKKSPSTLLPQFKIGKPYQLLTTDAVEQFLKDALVATPQVLPPGMPRPINRNPLYEKSKRVFRLGDVYFNKNRTQALVYFSVFTTTMDGSGFWRPFRKSASGQWDENRTWGCSGWGVIR